MTDSVLPYIRAAITDALRQNGLVIVHQSTVDRAAAWARIAQEKQWSPWIDEPALDEIKRLSSQPGALIEAGS